MRVTAPELLIYPWLKDLFGFMRQNPGLELHLLVGNAVRNLTRGEADIALRLTDSPPPHLVGRRVGRIGTAVYAHRDLDDQPLSSVPWVGWDLEDSPESATERVRLDVGGEGPVSVRVNTYALLLEAARCAAGAVLLPCPVGDREPELVRRTVPWVYPGHLWVLTHPDLRRSRRIRLAMEFLGDLVASREDELLGRLTG